MPTAVVQPPPYSLVAKPSELSPAPFPSSPPPYTSTYSSPVFQRPTSRAHAELNPVTEVGGDIPSHPAGANSRMAQVYHRMPPPTTTGGAPNRKDIVGFGALGVSPRLCSGIATQVNEACETRRSLADGLQPNRRRRCVRKNQRGTQSQSEMNPSLVDRRSRGPSETGEQHRDITQINNANNQSSHSGAESTESFI